MALTAEERKSELIEQLAREASARVAPEMAPTAEHFVRQCFARVAPHDIIYTAPETLLGSVMSLWDLGLERSPGVAKVRLFNPTIETHGWRPEHTVLEIVNDDMPFLVDSVAAELSQRDRTIHILIHPIIGVRRDAAGRRLPNQETNEAGDSFLLTESIIHVQFDQETTEATLESIRANIERILADVRIAVADWKAMRRILQRNVEELETSPPPLPADEIDETKEFLRWLDNDHFVYLGYRQYRFWSHEGLDYLEAVNESGLGILRELRPESARRSVTPFTSDFSRFARRKEFLVITKANNRSRVHRPVPMDRVSVRRFDSDGNLVSEDRFLGLFTSAAYSRSVRDIPLLRKKARRTLERSGFDPASHDGKALVQILEALPRDELFQISEDGLFEMSLGILQLQERQRVALFVRKDVFERFASCLVYVPRDKYDVAFRERARAIVETAFHGTVSEAYAQVTDSPLARVHFIVRTTPGEIPDYDLRRVEAYLAEAAKTWSDHLLEDLIRNEGEEAGLDLHKRYKGAFPTAYREFFSAATAIGDIRRIESILPAGGIVIDLYRHERSEGSSTLRCKIIHTGMPVPLSQILPRLENMGLRVESEIPHEIRPAGLEEPVRIRDFDVDLGAPGIDFEATRREFQQTFERVWSGEAEDDGFNRLVLGAGLDWHEVVVLRAYCKFLRQTGITLSEAYMQQTLAKNPEIARSILDLFETLFEPSLPDEQRVRAAEIRAGIEAALDSVSNIDEDRILRRYVNLVESTLRTNYYQRDDAGNRKAYLSFKFDSQALDELPLPRPMFEIFVYSPRVEGVHLRGGRVARGGIRWSDRREDFRTEVLGLMKAQTVKNVVIVPVGAKGGFVVKQPSNVSREAALKEGIECYRTFVRGLLDLTDNLAGDQVVAPPGVVRRDGDDTYLVVAADKGTATFSDIANGIAAEYAFWLGDAFASGGSAGYDHKKMGITARGAWESVKRHFRELGMDVQKDEFTVIGVGDMSGDVFGNGMLLSDRIKLIGAFNHLHIFVDPDPDPAVAFAERKRLFDLSRSSWIDYDPSLLSPGGAVYDRQKKSITVSDEVKACFDLPQPTLTPNELIQAILRARADLLWLGGIGTFVKASDEPHAAARDRTNDALRVNGDELRTRVVAEGANLGLTHRGRIELALQPASTGKINTDAIDNSAGVDTSDHEVNIKILVDDAVARGELSPERRLPLLREMTDEIAELVLRDNFQQTLAISIAAAQGIGLLDQQARLMRMLERAGRLHRSLEYLPDDETIGQRHAANRGLTRPEIAVLLAYSKIALYDELLGSDLPDHPLLVSDLVNYFPEQLRTGLKERIEAHRLRREIIASFVTNNMVNRVGPTFVSHIAEETGKPAADIARAYTISRDAFDMRGAWAALAALDYTLPAGLLLEKMIETGRLIERSTIWLLRSGYDMRDFSAYVEEFRPRVGALSGMLDEILPPADLTAFHARIEDNERSGFPPELARRLASLDILGSAFDIARISRDGYDVEQVGRVYFGLGARFDLERLRSAAGSIIARTPWQKAALSAVVDDLFTWQSILASHVLSDGAGPAGGESFEPWVSARATLVGRIDQLLAELRAASSVDLAMLTVASRQIGKLTRT